MFIENGAHIVSTVRLITTGGVEPEDQIQAPDLASESFYLMLLSSKVAWDPTLAPHHGRGQVFS